MVRGQADPLFPWPVGTSVVGRVTVFDFPLRRECKNHIFETITEPMSVAYDPGFVVATRCLVCADVLPALEVDSFVRATPADWLNCIQEVRTESGRLTALVDTLTMRSEGRRIVLRNFE